MRIDDFLPWYTKLKHVVPSLRMTFDASLDRFHQCMTEGRR